MILGIDYGLKNIGLATSEGSLAEPLTTIVISNQGSGVRAIGEITKKYQIDKIVVGVSEGKSKERATGFGKKLENVLGLPVEFVDETLSSYEAGGKDHSKAAAIILQRYLDDKNV